MTDRPVLSAQLFCLTPYTYRERGTWSYRLQSLSSDLGHSGDTVNVAGTLFCLGIKMRKPHVHVQYTLNHGDWEFSPAHEGLCVPWPMPKPLVLLHSEHRTPAGKGELLFKTWTHSSPVCSGLLSLELQMSAALPGFMWG